MPPRMLKMPHKMLQRMLEMAQKMPLTGLRMLLTMLLMMFKNHFDCVYGYCICLMSNHTTFIWKSNKQQADDSNTHQSNIWKSEISQPGHVVVSPPKPSFQQIPPVLMSSQIGSANTIIERIGGPLMNNSQVAMAYRHMAPKVHNAPIAPGQIQSIIYRNPEAHRNVGVLQNLECLIFNY